MFAQKARSSAQILQVAGAERSHPSKSGIGRAPSPKAGNRQGGPLTQMGGLSFFIGVRSPSPPRPDRGHLFQPIGSECICSRQIRQVTFGTSGARGSFRLERVGGDFLGMLKI